jgi:ferredoxin
MSFVDRLRVFQDRVTIWPEDECGQLPLAQLLAPGEPGSLLYCCGPPGLLDAVTAMAKDLGWPEEAVRIERFQPKAKPTDVPDRSLQVRANRSNRDVAVAADESILDALLHAGVTVPYTCREGVCGTCEVGVLGGRPDHRDDVLTTAQRESGSTMLVCVSRAEDDGLVLDI